MKKLSIPLIPIVIVVGVLVWALVMVWKSKADRTELAKVRKETDERFSRSQQEMNRVVQATRAELHASLNELKSKALPAPATKKTT